jgi:c-di-GMP-binding flagellar brake protein YcgR
MASYTQAIQTPLEEPDQLNNYRISGEEVVRLLQQLSQAGTIITAYFDAGRHYMFTSIIGQVEEQGMVVLDSGPDEAIARRALLAGRLLCTARHEGIMVRFTLDNLTVAKYRGLPAIAAPVPTTAYHLQRRACIRANTPTVVPATCCIPLEEGSPLSLPLADISCSGLTLIDRSESFSPELQQIYEGCLLTLPEFGTLTVDLQIRSRRPHYLYTHEQTLRLGAQFLHLSEADRLFLQRYVTKLQITAIQQE